MIVEKLKINENREEEVAHPVEGFPHVTCYEEMNRHPGGFVPWHWHSDVEFLWVMQGGFRMDTSNHSFEIRAGEGAFINSNVLHYKELLAGPEPIVLVQLFDAQLLLGGGGSVFGKKYIMPLIQCQELEAVALHPSVSGQRQIIELLKHSYDAAEQGEFGYEFVVRNDFSSIWCLLYKETESLIRAKKVISNQGEARIKKMMLFIREHYGEKISLEQIAEAASISGRECLRCFGEQLNTTPFSYLLDYRIRQAADRLRETDGAVTDIAYACGFFGTSYFGKMFKKSMGCTPSRYRQLCRKEAEEEKNGK